jgi:hypothetical protein
MKPTNKSNVDVNAGSLSVTNLLLNEYGVTAKPGDKIECVFCNKKTMSIKPDDGLAKCFHPNCEKFISVRNQGSQIPSEISSLHNAIFNVCKGELLRLLESNEDSEAIRFLIKERRIHKSVLEKAMVGVVPHDFNLAEHIENFSQSDETNGEIRAKLEKCFTETRAGWIVFFFANAKKQITCIKFRKPFSKEFVIYKPFEKTGVFGLGMYNEKDNWVFSSQHAGDGDEYFKPPVWGESLVVTEGEMNCLRLQSTLAETHHTFGNIVSAGSSSSFDFEVITRIDKTPIFFCDHDSAGISVTESARLHCDVRYILSDKYGEDPEDYVNRFAAVGALEAIKRKIKSPESKLKNFENAKENIKHIRSQKKNGSMSVAMMSFVKQDLLDRAELIRTDASEVYLSFGNGFKVVLVDPRNSDFQQVIHEYEILPTTDLFKHLTAEIQLTGLKHGKLVHIHQFTYYSKDNQALYWYNNETKVYKISALGIEVCGNGVDGFLFKRDPNMHPFVLDISATKDDSLNRLFFDRISLKESAMEREDRLLLLEAWMLSIFFESHMQTKAILATLGEKGSGKTFALKFIGKILFGEMFDVVPLPNKPDDFDAMVCHSRLCAIDNADTKIDWLLDKLAVVSTGGTLEKRQLFTTNEVVKFKPKCFVAITARTPKFRRDDIADRLIIMPMKRIQGGPVPESDLISEIEDNRSHILTQIALRLKDVIVSLNAPGTHKAQLRMADFFRLVAAVARSKNKMSRLPEVERILMQEQATFFLEEQPLFTYIHKVLTDDPSFLGKAMLMNDWYNVIRTKARVEMDGFFDDWSNGHFGQQFKKIRTDLERFYRIVEEHAGGNCIRLSFHKR